MIRFSGVGYLAFLNGFNSRMNWRNEMQAERNKTMDFIVDWWQKRNEKECNDNDQVKTIHKSNGSVFGRLEFTTWFCAEIRRRFNSQMNWRNEMPDEKQADIFYGFIPNRNKTTTTKKPEKVKSM